MQLVIAIVSIVAHVRQGNVSDVSIVLHKMLQSQ